MGFKSSKLFKGYPCAHRRWAHQGHCSLVHGYSRSFLIWFECDVLSEDTGFVMDFGALKPIKEWLSETFDHKLLIDNDDPLMAEFLDLEAKGGCRLTILEDVGMEGTALYVFNYVNQWVQEQTHGRVWVHSVECRENEKNSARYTNGY